MLVVVVVVPGSVVIGDVTGGNVTVGRVIGSDGMLTVGSGSPSAVAGCGWAATRKPRPPAAASAKARRQNRSGDLEGAFVVTGILLVQKGTCLSSTPIGCCSALL
jgi:hypothetical protein